MAINKNLILKKIFDLGAINPDLNVPLQE